MFPIRIPPLRERREDIPLLARYFAQKFAQQMQKRIETIPTVHMKALTDWDWPGNVRELANFIERAVILTRGSSLQVPVAELRGLRPTNRRGTRFGLMNLTQTAAPQHWDEIARIVQETIYALDSRKRFADEYAEKQHEEIVRTLSRNQGTRGRRGWSGRTPGAKSHDAALAHEEAWHTSETVLLIQAGPIA